MFVFIVCLSLPPARLFSRPSIHPCRNYNLEHPRILSRNNCNQSIIQFTTMTSCLSLILRHWCRVFRIFRIHFDFIQLLRKVNHIKHFKQLLIQNIVFFLFLWIDLNDVRIRAVRTKWINLKRNLIFIFVHILT